MKLSKRIVAAFAALAVAGVAYASDAYTARHEAMEKVGGGMGTLSAIAKKEKPFDAAVVQATAKTMEAELKKAAAQFLPDTAGGKSRAKAEIWTNRADFDAMMQKTAEALVALQGVKDEAALMPALRAAGGSCRTCHDKYRLPE